MAKQFNYQSSYVNGSCVEDLYAPITMDDLPIMQGLTEGRTFGSMIVDRTGLVRATQGLADGTYYSLTVLNGGVTGSTTPPPSPPPPPPPPPTQVFNHFTTVGNAGMTETDLYSDTLAAGLFSDDGDVLEIEYAGVADDGISATWQFYFGGSSRYSTGSLTLTTAPEQWMLSVKIIRISSSAVRLSFMFYSNNVAMKIATTHTLEVTGLTLSNTQAVKITVDTGAADDSVEALHAYAVKYPAP